jgi:hypothetical protein
MSLAGGPRTAFMSIGSNSSYMITLEGVPYCLGVDRGGEDSGERQEAVLRFVISQACRSKGRMPAPIAVTEHISTASFLRPHMET